MKLDQSLITVTLVTSTISPTFGIAGASVSLADSLADHFNVDVVTIDSSDTVSFKHSSITHRGWGRKELLGWKRLLTITRTARHRGELHDGVIIVSGVWAAIPVLLVMRKKGLRRTIVWEHSLTDQHVDDSLNMRILRAIARPLYGRAAAIVAVSDLVADDLDRAGFRRPIEVIPNLTRRFTCVEVAETIAGRLVTVGALVKVKNHSLALRTLALLPSRYSLDILGDGPERAALQQLAEQLGIADRVYFRGYVDNPDSYYQQAEVVIHPCQAETFGLVLFEAANHRRPVVVANGGMGVRMVPALVPGLAVLPEPNAFAEAIRTLEEQPPSSASFDDAAARRRSVMESVIPMWKRLITSVAADVAVDAGGGN